MNKIYDFILFETLFNSINHCKDLTIIARLLKDSGYSVAIADVFHEAEYCKGEGIPHISVSCSCSASLIPSTAKTSVGRYAQNLTNRFWIDRYLCRVIKEIAPQAKYIYAGTLMVGMPFMWLNKIPLDKKVFFWGLRSYYLTYYKQREFKYETLSSKILAKYFFSHNNIRFFISDEIIRKEFLDLGFKKEQLVLRPERMVEDSSQPTCSTSQENSDMRTILSIGTLRPQKRIDLCLKALSNVCSNNIRLIVAGRGYSENGYNEKINELVKDCNNAERIDKRLSDEEYNSLMESCDYLLLCDEKQLSSVTNGTMLEALLLGKPIIAPNYEPYKTTVETYKVGMLYDIDNQESIANALNCAACTSPDIYKDGLNRFRETLEYSNVLQNFKNELKLSLE